MENFINLTAQNIGNEHICCAFSDKKCADSYQLKKDWLKREFENGYVFRRIDARAKVFIEYGPAEQAWVPVAAPNYLMINCFWVSGQYKGKGYAKQLLQYAIDDAVAQGRDGLVTVVGIKKFHFMMDAKWLMKQGFEIVEKLPSGFCLLAKKLKDNASMPAFNDCVTCQTSHSEDLVVYYSNRCPFTEFHITNSLKETVEKRGLTLKTVKLQTMEQAQAAPSPATIFSLFYKGKFVTTDLSACMDSRFDKVVKI
ncbi:N-acetyltransferase [Dysgonomonas sp. 511]|uniref:N-acetyltransferase n=1 Tax=Dysgonomonas sp. 511 TaxID=2302930 RepID=UPI0013CFBD67|nr:N-acetyltransferase [Dysgonomonas sp. 511]NDV78128.1 GNAT family N-acetyltransferase [Dysgonomonas sp. 511]